MPVLFLQTKVGPVITPTVGANLMVKCNVAVFVHPALVWLTYVLSPEVVYVVPYHVNELQTFAEVSEVVL